MRHGGGGCTMPKGPGVCAEIPTYTIVCDTRHHRKLFCAVMIWCYHNTCTCNLLTHTHAHTHTHTHTHTLKHTHTHTHTHTHSNTLIHTQTHAYTHTHTHTHTHTLDTLLVDNSLYSSTLLDPELHGVPVAKASGQVTVKVKLKQNETVPGPKLEVDGFLGSLHLLFSPQQLSMLIEMANGILSEGMYMYMYSVCILHACTRVYYSSMCKYIHCTCMCRLQCTYITEIVYTTYNDMLCTLMCKCMFSVMLQTKLWQYLK